MALLGKFGFTSFGNFTFDTVLEHAGTPSALLPIGFELGLIGFVFMPKTIGKRAFDDLTLIA